MPANPHGLKLVERVIKGEKKESLISESSEMQSIEVSDRVVTDLENIAHGVYSPLEGFMGLEELESVLYSMRLPDDTPWTIPILLDASRSDVQHLREGDQVVLRNRSTPLAVMNITEIYEYDNQIIAERVFGTTSVEHPGVSSVLRMKNIFLAGRIDLLNDVPDKFSNIRLWPAEARVLFSERGWRTIVAFQTRNPPHIGHEFLQKTALAFADGLFINPVVGRKKEGDFKDEVIIEAYNTLIRNYFPKDSVVLSVLKYDMRYAGPREAVHHAIMRKNFGCTHIIIGRDHAGVGRFYGPYEAQEIFKEFPDLGITPLFFREFFYCRLCEAVVNERICPHRDEYRVRVSGTQLREMILNGEMPPRDYMRPDIARVILAHPSPFVGEERIKRREGGLVIWLTGLPGSGKTTIANVLKKRLEETGLRVEFLDGDDVRGWLSPEAGFSREDRERHLRRVAHVCHLLARNGVIVIAAFVSPYRSTRQYAKKLIGNFMEVYVKASLETCIKRDTKGLYKKALEGQITNMTGIQDVFEEPENPDVVVDTEALSPEEAAGNILAKLFYMQSGL